MSKKATGIIAIVAIIGLTAGTFFLYRNNKKRYAVAIASYGGSSQPLAWLLTLDEGYLKAWSAAIKSGSKTFTYNGKNYNPQGGKAIA
jgi:hypothetical protein